MQTCLCLTPLRMYGTARTQIRRSISAPATSLSIVSRVQRQLEGSLSTTTRCIIIFIMIIIMIIIIIVIIIIIIIVMIVIMMMMMIIIIIILINTLISIFQMNSKRRGADSFEAC